MFEFLFNYPRSVFSKGEFVLLGAWPKWVLALLVVAVAAGLAFLIRSRLSRGVSGLGKWRAAAIWLLQSSLAAVVLILLWQPAIMVAELRPQQNIIAILVDDSKSMAISENGVTRQGAAVKALDNGVLAGLQKNFQTRLYGVDARAARVATLQDLKPTAPVTHIGDSLKQLADETADLPIGAVVLLSDGADNAGGIDSDTIAALRNRHIPVHTVGFGEEQIPHDVEITDAVMPPRALADSRLAATVTFHQRGYAGRRSALTVRDGEKIVATHPITFAGDGVTQTETVLFDAGPAGAKTLQFSIETLPDEENRNNNAVTRMVNVDSGKRRVLYVEGEPRWEYKFLRRAEDDDHIVQLASMLRTTTNKIYRQGLDDPKELANGFPSTSTELFDYQALVIGSVEASYFTPVQQDLIREFVDRRGGGLLLLAGQYSLSDGGWAASSLADLLPVTLPNRKGTFHRDRANVSLTAAGADSVICRLAEDPTRNADRWKKLPYLIDYQDPGAPKPGAAVLAEMTVGGRKLPLLVTQNYGRGRTAVLATSGTWRWQMNLPAGDDSHDDFWRQMVRWLVSDTPGQVVASVPSQMLFDDGRIQFSADVRDKDYQPVVDAQVQAHIQGPQGTSVVDLTPDPSTPGVFHGDWNAEKPGSYVTEVTANRSEPGGNRAAANRTAGVSAAADTDVEIGRDSLTFARMDGVAENFHTEQNRALLENLSAQTGGRYWRPEDLSSLAREIPYSEAGITVREAKDLWNMPAVFLALLLLLFSEWLLRRKWGIV